jgi:hypothetical protein
MNPTDHAAMLRQTSALMEEAARAVERVEELEAQLEKHHVNGKRLEAAMPPPNPIHLQPLVERVLSRLGRYEELFSENEELRRENAGLRSEITSLGNHAICRLNLLGDIHRVLGSDGGETGANMLTGVPPELARLPKRIERLIRENETLARNVPPEPSVTSLDGVHYAQTTEAAPEKPFAWTGKTPEEQAALDELNALATTCRIVGQQWCSTSGNRTLSDAVQFYIDHPLSGKVLVLCNVNQNVVTGALTYEPVRVSDLPSLPSLP